jgi:hypothetical protein
MYLVTHTSAVGFRWIDAGICSCITICLCFVYPADEILYNNYKVRCATCSVCPTQLKFVMDIYQFAHSGADTWTPSPDINKHRTALYHVDAEEFELATTRTYTNFYNILGSRPTQLWTGGGYHYIQPQRVFVFEKVDKFKKFDQPWKQFCEGKTYGRGVLFRDD